MVAIVNRIVAIRDANVAIGAVNLGSAVPTL
jgi:hypothetical protein